ncbi:MAG: hypothetical protein WCI74_21045, partial [Actinomycetes bacterium]
EEQIAKVIREHDLNQLFVAFTATPAPATVSMFGKPFDSYTEAEAIAEGYIVDVAASIISYKTLYNLHCPIVPPPDEEEKLYSKGVVSKALQNVAFQDDGLIQYKAEVMLRIFEKDVKPLIGGRAKAMIVTSSRVAGLRYFNIIKEKLKERGADYKVLYAFSDFVHLETNATISEFATNELQSGELIEDRFEGDDYRLMVVANKFQTGFDQPLLAGMFLDKPVIDRNAVQTVSHQGRDRVRTDEADSRHRGHQGGGAVSGRDDQRRPGEAPAGQGKRRRRPGVGEGVRAGHDRADSRRTSNHRRRSTLHQTGDGREDR